MWDYRKRVLVVDDSPDARETIASYARECGYDVTVAASGVEALALAEASDFDAVVADIVMPGIGGIELAHRIKAIRPNMALVLVTGYADYADAVISIGAVPLLKPVTMSVLLQVLQDAIDAARA